MTEHFAQLLCDRMNILLRHDRFLLNATSFARYLGNIDIKTLFEIKFETETWRSRASSSTLSPKKRAREEILNVFISRMTEIEVLDQRQGQRREDMPDRCI